MVIWMGRGGTLASLVASDSYSSAGRVALLRMTGRSISIMSSPMASPSALVPAVISTRHWPRAMFTRLHDRKSVGPVLTLVWRISAVCTAITILSVCCQLSGMPGLYSLRISASRSPRKWRRLVIADFLICETRPVVTSRTSAIS